MADAAFDVPGTITLKMVSRREAGETPAARLFRLAQKAVIEGCHVYRIQGRDALFAVSSSRGGDVTYLVDVRAGSCTCEGFGPWNVCKHGGITLAELGELPDPEPPTPAAPAVRCPDCLGDGYRRMHTGNDARDWWAADCRRCLSSGLVATSHDSHAETARPAA
ncbi:MAG: hypothetical protein ACR2OO_00215 [Thermomicrobiales bacterium]